MIVRGSGYSAAAVGAKVYADHGVIFGKLWREEPPHQACAREAVHHQNGRPVSVPAHENRVSCNLDFRSLEGNLTVETCATLRGVLRRCKFGQRALQQNA